MNKFSTLDQLADTLLRLVNLLTLDPSCQWVHKFKLDLEQANRLKAMSFNSSDLAKLSASIRHVYGGMGSFNDYEPTWYDSATGRYVPIKGTEDFDMLRKKVFDLAIALITVGPSDLP
ncbi:hypothetical protein IHE31_06155 [Mycetohabitans rhizoxinica]|jgi:hypothetical protein|uniref:DUF6966 domain-containing protein n=1 Tax=Mycetohabitans TaxID=2571159 RepID=UPI0012FF18BA|nr:MULTISPECIES: hypothetical protein [Mycetohabitans]MCG1046298.1 hypothetical protein [Mycetohabitans sp. B6]